MDVNVRDVEEVVRFGSSIKSFVSDYLGALQTVVQGANTDRTTAENTLRRMRSRVESLESDFRNAQRQVEDAYDRAYRYPDEDHSDDIDYAERMMEEKQASYERAQQALDEAEGTVSRIKSTTERVIEEVYRSRDEIRDTADETVSAIKHAANAIAQYVKK